MTILECFHLICKMFLTPAIFNLDVLLYKLYKIQQVGFKHNFQTVWGNIGSGKIRRLAFYVCRFQYLRIFFIVANEDLS